MDVKCIIVTETWNTISGYVARGSSAPSQECLLHARRNGEKHKHAQKNLQAI